MPETPDPINPDSPLTNGSKSQLETTSAVSAPDSKTSSTTLKEKAGDAANKWLARNRNLVLRQTPLWAQSLVGLLIGLGSLVVVGSFLFKIDEVVSVSGQLKSIGGTVEVKTPAGGRVAKVFFKDGELVDKGQLLMRFDTRQALDQKTTLTRLIEVENKELTSRLKTIGSQQKMLRSRLDVIDKKLMTKTLIIQELQELVRLGGFQKLTFLEQKDQAFELQTQRSEIEEQFEQLDQQANQARLNRSKNIEEMSNRLREVELKLQYQNVLAPVTGILFDSKASPEGVLSPGERILSIVPQKGLYALVYVPNQDIGFVKTGQKAKVRVDAFPFSRYGELDGNVAKIGADALQPDQVFNFYRFPVEISLDKSFLEKNNIKIPLLSGMSVTSNLKLREKRVISLVSDLLVDQTDSVQSIRQQ